MLLLRVFGICVISLFGLASCITGWPSESHMEKGESVVLVTTDSWGDGFGFLPSCELGFGDTHEGRTTSSLLYLMERDGLSSGAECDPVDADSREYFSGATVFGVASRGELPHAQGTYRLAGHLGTEVPRDGGDNLGIEVPMGKAMIDFSYSSSGPFSDEGGTGSSSKHRSQSMLLVGVGFRF